MEEMAADALSKFSAAVLGEAGEQQKELIRRLEQEKEQRLAQKEKELSLWKKKAISAGTEKLKRESALSVSGHRAELKKNLFASRDKIAENVFRDVEKNLRAFTESAEYGEYLRTMLESGDDIFEQGQTVCTARAEDLEKLRPLLIGKQVAFAETGEDIIGGFILKNTTAKLCADCTLRTRLAEQKKWFYENSGMIVG